MAASWTSGRLSETSSLRALHGPVILEPAEGLDRPELELGMGLDRQRPLLNDRDVRGVEREHRNEERRDRGSEPDEGYRGLPDDEIAAPQILDKARGRLSGRRSHPGT